MSALTPRAILAAAAADLLAHAHKRAGALQRGERYCFLAEHVGRADSVPQLLELAFRDRQRGLNCSKRLTRAIYDDADGLAAALILARKGGAR